MPIPLGILAVAGAGAAGGGPAYELLATTIVSGSSTSSVTFSGLGSYSDYKHLQIRYTAKTTAGNSRSDLYLRFNGNSGSNYAMHRLQGDGLVLALAQTGQTEIYNALLAAGSFNATNVWASGIIDILDFSSTNKNTTLRSLNGLYANVDTYAVRFISGGFFNTAAITSIQIFSDFGPNYVAGSRFSLYGIK